MLCENKKRKIGYVLLQEWSLKQGCALIPLLLYLSYPGGKNAENY